MPSKTVNPFYILLVMVGVVFTITACSYFVMALRADHNPKQSQADIQSEAGLMALMDRHGETMLIVELVVLAVATVAAIGSDHYWQRPAEPTVADSDAKRDDIETNIRSPIQSSSQRDTAL